MVVAQYLMGAIFVVMGINGFVHFLPLPGKSPEAEAFLGALARTGYFWPFEKFCEVLFGTFLLTNRWVVLAVEGFAPIIFNIILFHLFLDLGGIPLALVVLVCEIILLIGHWEPEIAQHFRPARRAASSSPPGLV
jgi:hypothetical protein